MVDQSKGRRHVKTTARSSDENLGPVAPDSVDNHLHLSWCDSQWVPSLNASNVLDYFSERSNPFYSRECNNEFLKMQQSTRLEQLQHMQGTEYMLLHAQDPILYIVRKQHRFSPTQVNPSACYHIIGGTVFQTPDIGSVINSRMVSALYNLNGAFSEMQSLSHYHPSKGYWWQSQKQALDSADANKKKEEKKNSRKEEMSTVFQRRRVDLLLGDLSVKFPYKQSLTVATAGSTTSAPSSQTNHIAEVKTDVKAEVKSEVKAEVITKQEPKVEIKQEPKTELSAQASQRNSKPPPEKRQRTGP